MMNRSSNAYYCAQATRQTATNGSNKLLNSPIFQKAGRRCSTGTNFSSSSRPVVNKNCYSPGSRGHHASKMKFHNPSASPATVSTASISSHSSIVDLLVAPFTSSEVSPWMRDSGLANTAVFRRRNHQPATRIQSAVRGMLQRKRYYKLCLSIVNHHIDKIESVASTRIQSRVRGNQARDVNVPHLAALCIQSFFKSCLARMTSRASFLAVELYRIRTTHTRELFLIERNKNIEMKRIYKELTEEAAAKERAQEEAVSNVASTITHFRKDNAKLRDQNKTLQKATRILAKKNARAIKLIDQTYKNIFELRDAASSLESDNKQIKLALLGCQKRVDEYNAAHSRLNEHLDAERKIGERYVHAINDSLKHIHSTCSDKQLSGDIIRAAQSSLGLLDTPKA